MGFKHATRRPKIRMMATGRTVEIQLQANPILVVTTKNFEMGAGQWYMHLKPMPALLRRMGSVKAQSYIYNHIKPMDLVTIGFNKRDGAMMGFVDNVYRSKTVMGEKTHRIVVVRGRDFGKLLIEDRPRYAPLGAALPTDKVQGDILEKVKEKLDKYIIPTKVQLSTGKEGARTHPYSTYWQALVAPENFNEETGKSLGNYWVDQKLDVMIEFFVGVLSSFRTKVSYLGEQVNAVDLIGKDLKPRPHERIASTTINTLTESAILNQINSVLDQDFYEFWIDHKLDDRGLPKAFIRFRPKPWDFDDDKITDFISGNDIVVKDSDDEPFTWEKTTNWITDDEGNPKEFHIIPEVDILKEGMGVADYQAYSAYIVNNSRELLGATVFLRFGMNYPIFDFLALSRYGSRTKLVNSKLVTENRILPELSTLERDVLNRKSIEYELKIEELQAAQEALGDDIADAWQNVNVKRLERLQRSLDRVKELELNLPKPDVPTEEEIGTLKRAIRWRRDRIFNWFKYNPIMESGTVTIRGNEDMRIGDKVKFPDMEFNHKGIDDEGREITYKGVDAYVNGVKNVWAFGAPFKTELRLIRGHNREALRDYERRFLPEDAILKV